MELGANRTTLSRLTQEDPAEVLKECDAHEILKLSLLNEKFNFQITRGFKTGEPVRANLVLSRASEIELTFAQNSAHNFTWQFNRNISHLEGEKKRILLESKIFYCKSWFHQKTKYCILECKRPKTVRSVFLLLRLLRSIFNISIGTVVIDARVLHPFTCTPGTIDILESMRCEKLHIREIDVSHCTLANILNKIQVSKVIMMQHPLKEGAKGEFILTPKPCSSIMYLKRTAMECFSAAGKMSTFTIKTANSSDLNKVIFDWMHGTNQSIKVFDLKIKKFRWDTVSDLFNIFKHLAPDESASKFLTLSLHDKLLMFSMEGVDVKRNDGAIGTIHFSPNTPDSETGHRFLLHVRYPKEINEEIKVEKEALQQMADQKKTKRLEECRKFFFNHETLRLHMKSRAVSDRAGFPMIFKSEEEFYRNGKIVLKSIGCRMLQVKSEIDELEWELEQSRAKNSTDLDEKKREMFGYFHL